VFPIVGLGQLSKALYLWVLLALFGETLIHPIFKRANFNSLLPSLFFRNLFPPGREGGSPLGAFKKAPENKGGEEGGFKPQVGGRNY